MADTVMQTLIDTLLKAPGVGDRCVGRIGDRHPKTITQPIYPMVTLFRDNDGYSDRHFPGFTYPLLITVYSTISSDEAVNIHTAIRTALHCIAFQRDGVAFVSYQAHPPISYHDDTAELVYLASSSYDIEAIGP